MGKDFKHWSARLAKSPTTRFLLLGALGIGIVLLVSIVDLLNRGQLLRGFDGFVNDLGSSYRHWFRSQTSNNLLVLMPLSFAGGLVASISPCILSLLPINLSYIGTREITSRRDALIKAALFVLGVVTVLSSFGLFSAFAAIVLVQFRGYFHLLVGAIIIVMGLSLAGLVHLPLPQLVGKGAELRSDGNLSPWRLRWRSLLVGPFGVGLTFALVSSPCTSPVMFAVLTAGAATGSQLHSVLMMFSYALGYTAIIFIASLFTGLAKQAQGLLAYSNTIVRFASISLILVGGFYLVSGGRWVIASLRT
jgi:cytochrome c-type biogenesis protein